MRILQLTNKIPYPPKDGGAIATLLLSRGLAALNHQVTLLGMNTSKHYSPLSQLPEELRQTIRFEDVQVNTDICMWAALRNLLFSRKPYNAVRFFSKEYEQKLIRVLQQNTFDIIQLEGLYLAYYIDTIRQHSSALIALRAHNIEHEIWQRTASQEKSWLKKIYLRILARRIRRFKLSILNTYDLLIPITERDATQFNVFGNTRPSLTIPVGFDTSQLKPAPEKIEFPSVFFIGTLDWFPNQEGVMWFLEKVWPDIRAKHPALEFRIAGRNAPAWLQNKLKSQEGVRFLGEIDDAYTFMNENAIMVAPLFSGSGMRVKIIEGMAMGKTIVTTSIGAEGIEVTPGTNIIIEDQPHDFIRQMLMLLENKEKFEQIGRSAVNFVRENFDNQIICASLAQFYQKHLQS